MRRYANGLDCFAALAMTAARPPKATYISKVTSYAAFAPRARRYAARHPLAHLAPASWWVGAIGVRVARFAWRRPSAPPCPPAERMVLAAADGSRIAAMFWRGASAAAPGVVMVPGLAATKEGIASNAAHFASLGYAVLLIDVRGHGGSSPAPHSFGWNESLDVHAAFAWLKQRQNGAPIAVLGISMGAAAALIGPHGNVPADALILQAPFADLRRAVRARIALVANERTTRRLEPLLSMQARQRIGVAAGRIAPLAAFTGYPGPTLLIGGGRDVFVPVAEVREFAARARQPAAVWIDEDLGHKGISDTIAPAYRARVSAFLAWSIGTPT